MPYEEVSHPWSGRQKRREGQEQTGIWRKRGQKCPKFGEKQPIHTRHPTNPSGIYTKKSTPMHIITVRDTQKEILKITREKITYT